jgi:hypothetical protein
VAKRKIAGEAGIWLAKPGRGEILDKREKRGSGSIFNTDPEKEEKVKGVLERQGNP